MTKYRNYKNKLEMFLASRKGRRFLNVAYSWGAAIVILGALFKLLHWPFGNQMLFIGMMTEFLVFFISGLEKPEEQYRWEQVFPDLLSINPLDRQEIEEHRKYLTRKSQEVKKRIQEYEEEEEEEKRGNVSERDDFTEKDTPRSFNVEGVQLPEDDVDRLSKSLKRLDEAVNRLATLGEISATTVENSRIFAESQENLGKETQLYQQRISDLNKTMTSLNEVYSSQLRDISNQVEAIDEINRRLDGIRYAYQSSQLDSESFRRENSLMIQRIRELNQVYARLLEAMTVNMGAMPMHPYNGNDAGYRSMRTEPYSQGARFHEDYPREGSQQ